MNDDSSPTTLLRVAAFLLDALLFCLLLILPSAVISYGIIWLGGSTKLVNIVWYLSLLLVAGGVLLRDGIGGRSPGKRLLGLTLRTPGEACGYGRSVVRNVPLLIPGWNLIEAALVLFSRSTLRTGDRIARTRVVEE